MAKRDYSAKLVPLQDLKVGAMIGRLTLLHRDESTPEDSWTCRCKCGTVVSLTSYSISRGKKSCGCWNTNRNRSIHGMSCTSVYNCWWGINYRGQGKSKEPCYANGNVRVCRRWRESFESFYEDMGDRPSPKHSIDRIDNSKGYLCGKCKECTDRGDAPNCRWATKKEQAANRSSTHFVTHDGKTHSITEWSRLTGISRYTIAFRLAHGWPISDALTKPPRLIGHQKKSAIEHSLQVVVESTSQT